MRDFRAILGNILIFTGVATVAAACLTFLVALFVFIVGFLR